MILLIEDNALLAYTLKLLLNPAEVIVASTMSEAKVALRRIGPSDTVLVDLKLPDSAPLETLCRISEWKGRSDCPRVIIITGLVDRRIIEAAHASDADAVALKNDSTGFFESLRDLGLIGGLRPRTECAHRPLVERIEREVRGMVSG